MAAAPADPWADIDASLRYHASPLMALSMLAYMGVRDIHKWSASLMEDLHDSLRAEKWDEAQTLLKPYLLEGFDSVRQEYLPVLGAVLGTFRQEGCLIDLHEGSGLDTYVVQCNQGIAVVFTGSTDGSDVLADLDFAKVRFGDGQMLPVRSACQPVCGNDVLGVHRGFWTQYTGGDANKKIVKTVVRTLEGRSKDCPVLVSGHSLGAALATLCGLELAQQLENPVRVINFASPRVGNEGFKQACKDQPNLSILRVKKDHDPVTTVPTLGYTHVGQQAWLRDDTVQYSHGESWEEFLLNVPYILKVWGIVANFVHATDHLSSGYWAAIEKRWPLEKVKELMRGSAASERVSSNPDGVERATSNSSSPDLEAVALQAKHGAGGDNSKDEHQAATRPSVMQAAGKAVRA